MSTVQSDAFVFFGATGDLAYKQIFPALQEMIKRGSLDVPVIGVAKAGWNLAQLRDRARDSVQHAGVFEQAAYDKLCSLMRYIDGDYADPATFQQLRDTLAGAQHPLHYLAIPPSLFETVVASLAASGCAQGARIVVEKPFGHDLASAEELNRTLHRYFPESSIFRIDHYLGKEPVQNLIYFRFGNSFVEPIWNRDFIDSIQITMAESFGVQGRGAFYDETGAIRDVIQNHMLQVTALLTMEAPVGNNPDGIRDAKSLLLKAIRPLDPENVVRGQFRGYREEPGVSPDSEVETFAAVRLHIDSWRWNGVPVFIRAGKHLPVTATEIWVDLKCPAQDVFAENVSAGSNYFRFRLSPNVVIAVGARTKVPGDVMKGEDGELTVREHPANEEPPYQRLLTDAMKGDIILFARQDTVEAAWRVVDPILGNRTAVFDYDPGTWGPDESEGLTRNFGGWHDPEPPPEDS